jgi:metal-sulfur cluster biosynthetic enzyme
MTTTADRVLAALAEVYDPEVDMPVTEMGFIREVEVHDNGNVVVHMQLPQFFCAPNFTYLMVDDVRRAAEDVVGSGKAKVNLVDHFESGKISQAASAGASFLDTFADAAQDLDELRNHFARKTFLIRQEHVCRELIEAGLAQEDLVGLSLAQALAKPTKTKEKYLKTRNELKIDAADTAAFLVAADGRPVTTDQLRIHRRSASVMAVSFEGNGFYCRTLIEQRYPGTIPVQERVETDALASSLR